MKGRKRKVGGLNITFYKHAHVSYLIQLKEKNNYKKNLIQKPSKYYFIKKHHIF